MKVKLDAGAFAPERAHDTDAGLDLRAREDARVPAHGSATFDTGVHIELPHGYYGKIESKSGLNVNHSVVSCGGVIDEGYTGSIAVKLYNHGDAEVVVERGDKISQLVILPVRYDPVEIVEEISGGERGDKGFGSSGR